MKEQLTSDIMMVRPANFGYNDETAVNNSFQKNIDGSSPEDISKLARLEFDNMVAVLRQAGVNVLVIEDTPLPLKRDAIFPNNWISMHENGYIFTYPMFSENRQQEVREDVIKALGERFGINRRISLESFGKEGRYLEGTGSMILDRQHGIAYACKSQRTDERLLSHFCEVMSYEKVIFDAHDQNNYPIYHTNVMMALGESFVIVCLDAIRDTNDRARVVSSFNKTGKQIIPIDLTQVNQFAGNMLQVKNDKRETFLVMSTTAFNCLAPNQKESIREHTNILHSDVSTIERF